MGIDLGELGRAANCRLRAARWGSFDLGACWFLRRERGVARLRPVQCHDIGNTCCQDMGYTFSDDDGFLVASKEAVMPWKALSMYEQRLALIHRIVTLKQAVGEVAKEFGVRRKTVHKWLGRYRGH